ncbi:hypothetical protein TEA_003402 [Camellia sinensis var. sinensis]|uniref:peptide-methionine (S)-S-oxide reductase n=1 Tax=Camellia sinensis var. sinensis TaxID=542762 RepID=A0A4S4EGY8_CAMSN|nr:hypothetical protein TEA_003402 [Camellia sinensis var. sinensis]
MVRKKEIREYRDDFDYQGMKRDDETVFPNLRSILFSMLLQNLSNNVPVQERSVVCPSTPMHAILLLGITRLKVIFASIKCGGQFHPPMQYCIGVKFSHSITKPRRLHTIILTVSRHALSRATETASQTHHSHGPLILLHPPIPDDDVPAPGQSFAQFEAGCFWGVELAFQRVSAVTKTEVALQSGPYSRPLLRRRVFRELRTTRVVRVQYDPKECSY